MNISFRNNSQGPFLICVAWFFLCSSSALAKARWEELHKNNPFGDEPTKATTPPPAPAQLELRGVSLERGEYWFSVYDATKQKSSWVRKNDQIAATLVGEFDREKNRLTLENSSGKMILALKSPPATATHRQMLAVAPKQKPPALITKAQISDVLAERRKSRLKQNPNS